MAARLMRREDDSIFQRMPCRTAKRASSLAVARVVKSGHFSWLHGPAVLLPGHHGLHCCPPSQAHKNAGMQKSLHELITWYRVERRARGLGQAERGGRLLQDTVQGVYTRGLHCAGSRAQHSITTRVDRSQQLVDHCL